MRFITFCIAIVLTTYLPENVESSVCGYGCSQRYTTSCGLFGWDRCTRHRGITCYRCCAGWTGSTSTGCTTPICFGLTTCPNGGRCTSPNYCSNCNRGYYSPQCAQCTQIAHCLAEFCSTSSDQKCDTCDGDYGPALGSAYKKTADMRQCNKQCSWRSDSNACYPGSCTNAHCTCTSGFSGPDCRNIQASQSPVMSKHRATLIRGTTTLESPSEQGSTATVYTNVRNFTSIRINWISSYQPTGLTHYNDSGHVYVKSVSLGIVAAKVTAVVNRAHAVTYSVGSSDCSTSTTGTMFDHNNPATVLVACERTFTLDYSSWTAATSDVLSYDVQAENGGYLKLFDRDHGNNIITRYYNGQTITRSSTFTFDFVDPYHCISGCRTTMLNAGSDVTSQSEVTVTWQDWMDDLAGIEEYHLQVRQLSGTHGDHMTEIFDSPAVYDNITDSGQDVTLPHIGVYSFILTVIDNAGNHKLSRRFVFYDDDPNDVTLNSNSTMHVVSATVETDYVWQTNVDMTGGRTSVEIDWKNRFMNYYHYNQGLLKPIGSYVAGSIDDDYDQNFGQRGRAKVPNALGVTKFLVLPDIDHMGGRTTINATESISDNWRNETTNTQATYDLDLVDGDSIRFWVEARDIAGHFVRDNVLIHLDSSPPMIEDFWLVRDGEVNVVLHKSADLHDMSVVFRTYDIHSGIRTIEWRLYDNYTGSEVELGRQTVPARKINTEECDPVSCVCVPIGDCYATDYGFNPTFNIGVHDFDYFITLTVTNHARLVTTQTIKITVDTSPPQTGVVHDGMQGSNEVDYQEVNDLTAHWDGFFDKESGVMFYEYLFDVSCLNDETSHKPMTRTTSNHASWTAPSPGQYYITVIAYNRALEPSEAVCSDGVVIDATPPELSEITISNGRMWPGLAKDNDGRVWMIDAQRRRLEFVNASSSCSSKATMVDDILVYPTMPGSINISSILNGDVNCTWMSGIEEKFFLAAHKHVLISWTGLDSESSIYDYEIGLTSNPLNPTPDLVTFISTSGHDQFMMYHPLISQGSVFHLVVKAVNKAQLSTAKVIGSIIVDTSPPMFVGQVTVGVDDDHLVVEWGDRSFIDDEDTGLRYQVGIGSTSGGTDTLAFQTERNYKLGPCLSRTSCAAFSLANLDWYLHGDHEYYVSVKAQNGAGLSTIGTSSVYRHIVQLPSKGVVLDVAPPGEMDIPQLGIAKDIDVQMNTSSISARWFGFEHPHLDINYEIAVGSGETGSFDVSGGFIDVGMATSYRLDNLNLTPLMIYFVTVRATSSTGSVNVTSDGIKIIPREQILDGATIKDGLGCDPDNASSSSGSHQSPQPCQDDISYQSSTSDISSRWTIPEMLQPFVTNILWGVEQEVEIYLGEGNITTDWIAFLDSQDLGMTFQHIAAGIGLHDGAHYRSKVQFCHVSVCFLPIVTDGFWVLSQPPEVGDVMITSIQNLPDKTEIGVRYDRFVHEYVAHDNQLELMDYYEWSITENAAMLSHWKRIDDFLVTGETIQFTAHYESKVDHGACLHLSIRGYNKAGLSSIASTEIHDCDDVTLIIPHLVIDADHEVTMEQNAVWPEPDKNYISSTTTLSAVWPTLRHRDYVWAAIEDTGSSENGNLDNGLNYPCDHPLVKACGKTGNEFVNVPNLSLEHGKRYRICIHADNVTVEYELWKQTLPSVSSCSDGVVIDTTPPTPGSVWIGWNQHQTYQTSTSELVLHWDPFIDVEEHSLTRHRSAIKYYEYSLGSVRGGSDVKEFTRIGITNNIIIHNLRLQNGYTYYATIRGTDFVDLSAEVMSDSVTIDTSPPIVTTGHTLSIGGSFIKATTSVSASWENVFSDKESGIAYYEWGIGSHPGHGDIMPFTRENSQSGVNDPSRPLTLQEGHSYFISVKAVNNVGLITLKSFGAFTVEASPPLAGHVFDGNLATVPANHRDQDFQDNRRMLSAFWEGFHDPHSALVGYSWKAGICKGCSDVIPEQHVGLDTNVSADNLNLVPGLTYYVTVTSCNAADLCTSVTSDGVMIDDSPPVAGHVYDGAPGSPDINYQSSRSFLSAHWWGFHDPHSGLAYYEWSAGTRPAAGDILPFTRIELSEDAMIFLSESNLLPIGSNVYITVRAYNQLGMWTQATSNGFSIDSTPPVVVNAPVVDVTVGMILNNTQVLHDVLRFSWLFKDAESGIKDQYVSITTHHNGDVDIPPIKIAGSEIDHTFTNLQLHDGSQYIITVIACNYAGLCTEAKTDSLLVDSSPPSVGTFAVSTESAANLGRHDIIWITPTDPALEDTTQEQYNTTFSSDTVNTTQEQYSTTFTNDTQDDINSTDWMNSTNITTASPDTTPSPPRYHSGWMTWLEDTSTSTSSLALAWLGFTDVHSGISHYFISVGFTFGGSELTKSGPVRIDHSNDSTALDEGVVHTAIVPLEGSITGSAHPYIFVSIWAVNGVGISSGRHHSTFETSPTSPYEGALVLLRRCSSATCEGHCGCAPIDQTCAPGHCNHIITDNPNSEIEVLDTLDLTFHDINTVIDIDDTPTRYMLAAAWRVIEQKGLDIKWYEWSIGDDSSSDIEPSGVFDPVTERIWFDVGQDNHTVILLDEDKKLTSGVRYHIFIRAWYDTETYAVFRSDGIIPDVTPPRIVTTRGTKIKDLKRADSSDETDYLTDPSIVYISWHRVFLDSNITHYQVSLSTYPGGEDVRLFAEHTFPASDSSTYFDRLRLKIGQRYYSNVRAFNKAGLHTVRSSDGFIVDVDPPNIGLVFDGRDLHDVEYQNSSAVMSASWHGFVDVDSYIDHYEWCIYQSNDPSDDSMVSCMDVGIQVSATRTPVLPLTQGMKYYSKVSAFDASGRQSESVSSDGVIVDTTPPEPQEHIHRGHNLILNPSFEELEEPNPTDMVETSTEDGSLVSSQTDSTDKISESDPTIISLRSDVPSATDTWAVVDDPPTHELVGWNVSVNSQFSLMTSGKKIAKDGYSYLSLHGSISQTINTTPGSHYLIVFFASHVVSSHNPLLNQEGRIQAPGLNRVFWLYDRPTHGHSEQDLTSIKWQEHRFYFTATGDISILIISSVGETNGILLDYIQVMGITIGASTGEGSVVIHTQFIHSWSSIQADWYFIDPESPILDYSWAIGTTLGGTQLQGFTSTGLQTTALNTDLKMSHGSHVIVTVIARNAADLIAIATSDLIMIDLTPPVIHYVIDGGSQDDIDFSSDDTSLSFSWSASDPESGVKYCQWSVGSEQGFDDIIPSSASQHATSTATISLNQTIVEGQRLYVTVKCHNHAEQSSWKSSDGVTIVTEHPMSSAAVVNIITVSETQYETRRNYQSQRHILKGSWDGFMDPYGIQQYQCRLIGPSSFMTSWSPCGSTSETRVDWSGLHLEDDVTYSLSVRAINHANLASQAITQNVTVESSTPIITAASLLTDTWLDGGIAKLKWDGLFSASSSLVYEVSLGTIPGGSDIMQWIETMETSMQVSPLAPFTDYHLTLTAINAAGLSQTVTKIINDV